MGALRRGMRGLGLCKVRGLILVPKPPARITASMMAGGARAEISVRAGQSPVAKVSSKRGPKSLFIIYLNRVDKVLGCDSALKVRIHHSNLDRPLVALMMKETNCKSSNDTIEGGLTEDRSNSTSLNGNVRKSWRKPSRMSYVQVIAAVIAFLIFASLKQPEPPDWEPSTYEEWLYDGFYNASEIGYDTDVWGGRVIKEGDFETLINQDSKNLTLPVFVYDAVKLTDDYINETVVQFFPDINMSSLEKTRLFKEGDRLYHVELQNSECRIKLTGSGGIDYTSKLKLSSGDIMTNESAVTLAFDYLAACGMVLDDIGYVDVSRHPYSTKSGIVTYTVKLHRYVHGFRIYPSGLCNKVMIRFEGSTTRIDEFEFHWPELKMPFVVTDLPTTEDIMDYHGFHDNPALNISNSFRENVTYFVPNKIQQNQYDCITDLYFILPYRYFYIEDHHMMHHGKWCSVIFPERHY
jgi:hypothetical protein